jgi:hypothetical protein
MAIVSTYGLDDEAFEHQRSAWDAWWRERYPDAEAPVA